MFLQKHSLTRAPLFGFSPRIFAAGLCLCLLSSPPLSARPDWFDQDYNYLVLDQEIRATFADFGRNLNIAVSLSDRVQGRTQGQIDAATAGEFLDRLTQSNGLNWYFDGAILHISAAAEYATRIFPTGALTGDQILQEMQRLDLADDRYGVQGGQSTISASGPPAYVAMVGEFVDNMQPDPALARPLHTNGDDSRVRVFRGRLNTTTIATNLP